MARCRRRDPSAHIVYTEARDPATEQQSLSLGRAALQLALTRTQEEEQQFIALMQRQGLRCAATEVGGRFSGFLESLTQGVIGAALNRGVIRKEPGEMHALLHATMEARQGCLVDSLGSASVAFKVAIVRSEKWLAVAMFGYSGLHRVTNHERAGLGMMHIADG